MNKRIVYYEVEHCIQCPFIDSDINITRYSCQKTGKMICWMGVGENDAEGIPDWCPLPEANQEQYEDEEE